MIDLQSCRAKLERARTHKLRLESECQEFLRNHEVNIISEIDVSTGDKIWRVNGPVKLPELNIGLTLGDAIYNYRASLNYLAQSLVEINGQVPTSRTDFPLFDDLERLNRYFSTETRGMSPEARAMIKAEQPCFLQGNPYRARHLADLDHYSNVDRHRHLNLVVSGTNGGLFNPTLPWQFASSVHIHAGPIRDGTIMAKVPSTVADVEFYAALDLAIEKNSDGKSGETITTFLGFVDYLISEIIDRFEHKFFSTEPCH